MYPDVSKEKITMATNISNIFSAEDVCFAEAIVTGERLKKSGWKKKEDMYMLATKTDKSKTTLRDMIKEDVKDLKFRAKLLRELKLAEEKTKLRDFFVKYGKFIPSLGHVYDLQ